MFRKLYVALALSLIASTSSFAATLSGTLTADDAFVAYISTNDSEAGSQIASGNNWPTAQSFSGVNLTPGQDYYLHVYASDLYGAISAFLGDFTLSGTGFSFANNSTSLVTNPSDWQVSLTGFGSNYLSAPYDYGANGNSGIPGATWGPRPGISSSAHWIWSTQGTLGQAYFSTKITSTVPVPAAWGMMALGLPLIRLVSRRKKQQ